MASAISSLHFSTEMDWRGGERQTLALVQGLQRRGHRAVLAASPRSQLFRYAARDGVERVGIHAWNEADLLAVARLALLLRRLRPAVLHLHSSHAHTLGLMAAVLAPGVLRVA